MARPTIRRGPREPIVQAVPLLALRSLGDRAFDYRVRDPDGGRGEPVPVGTVVRMPFGGRRVPGVVVALGPSGEVDPDGLSVAEPLSLQPVPADLLALSRDLAAYYLAPWGACLRAVVPDHLLLSGAPAAARHASWVEPGTAGALDDHSLTRRQREVMTAVPPSGLAVAELCRRTGAGRAVVNALVKKGFLVLTSRALAGTPPPLLSPPAGEGARPLVLSEEQRAALAALTRSVASGGAHRHLLWGVTGSGKTEVYVRVLEEVIASGGGAIVLVPEIALTGQLVERFRARFGPEVGVLHSALTKSQRAREHARIAGGAARVVVGARSAVFAPVKALRVIIVDEAHDSSYKQEEEPRYDARTVAWWRIERCGGLLVEGTATPRVESLVGDGRPLRLVERPSGGTLPTVEVVDMRRQGAHAILAPRARRGLEECLGRGEQAVVLLNRRGYAGHLRCDSCGHVPMCPHCEVSLTYHRHRDAIVCHHCGFSAAPPALCPACGQSALTRGSPGTEKLADELLRLVPRDGLFRLDSDVVTSGVRVQEVLAAFARSAPGILVGTQMVAKGHDFPLVTLVVVADADTGLYVPDFRAAERTFQLLVQVAGRAGRGAQPGRVLVQTWNPDVACIRMAVDRDVEGFYREELATRERLGYPPCRQLIRVLAACRDEGRAEAGARYLAERLGPHLEGGAVRGPARLPRLRGRGRWQLLVAGEDGPRCRHVVARAAERLRAPYARRGVDLVIDVDPQWFT